MLIANNQTATTPAVILTPDRAYRHALAINKDTGDGWVCLDGVNWQLVPANTTLTFLNVWVVSPVSIKDSVNISISLWGSASEDRP